MSQTTCPSCGYPLVSSPEVGDAMYCHRCQRWQPVAPPQAVPAGVPPPPPPPVPDQWYPRPQPAPNPLGGLIPTANPSALIAYYLGVFSLIPCLGLLPAIPALILGIRGLIYVKQHPQARGVFHAWAGIVLGGIFTLVWGAALVVSVIPFFTRP